MELLTLRYACKAFSCEGKLGDEKNLIKFKMFFDFGFLKELRV